MSEHFDVAVVGSGFGGAITACRLAQGGMRVCILERGRRWSPEEYPLYNKKLGAWFWTSTQKGIYQLITSKKIDVLVAAGVGGGSLIYNNVMLIPPEDVFEQGWPESINLTELTPYYQRVRDVLHPTPYPRADILLKTKALQRCAELTGRQKDFQLPDLAIFWGSKKDEFNPDPYGFGTSQRSCADLAECMTGCPIRAKNTLDLNYIALALQKGADLRPLHEVSTIERQGKDFIVHYVNHQGQNPQGSLRASRVILAAGALGSTGILLNATQKYKTLGSIGSALGRNFSGNGDFLAALFNINYNLNFKVGPIITAMINYPEQNFIVEDAGLPPVLNILKNDLRLNMKTLPLAFMGRDGADGIIKLKGKRQKLGIEWSLKNSMQLFKDMEHKAHELASSLGGIAIFPPTWSIGRKLITVHPLGGCPMSDSPQNGVVDGYGAVYGQPGLYVADGSIVPTALGVNPSFSIAALAERIAEQILKI